jgi:hypothetical protein
MTKYIKPMAAAPSYKSPGEMFPMHHVEHEGLNPMFQAKVQKTFQVQPAKLAQTSAPKVGPNVAIGSPWTIMGGKAK